MPLLLTNDDVDRVIEMDDALEAMEGAMVQFAEGDAVHQPRTALWSPTAADGDYYRWSCQLGATRSPPRFTIRFKSEVLTWTEHDDGSITESKHNVSPGTYMGLVQLFDSTDGALIGILPDGVIQHVRTATTAGIACKYLAREDAETVGLLGSGGMARTYLEAFDAVRDLEAARVYSPTEANRLEYAEEMGARLGLDVQAVGTPEAAMTGVDIAATCTNSLKPVYDPDWLEPGQFLVNVGPVEIPDEVPHVADRAFTTRPEPGVDHIIGTEAERSVIHGFYPQPDYEAYTPMGDVLTGEDPGRTDTGEAIFYQNVSIGGLQFVSIGNSVFEKAREAGYGTELPLSWFQESVKS